MSGAVEGITGLALSAVSLAALFTTCIECFDIVIAAKNFSEDYEQLCALFSLQRARFGLWGESVGLVPNPNDGRCLRYDKKLDRPDIRPGVERILNNIKSLLDEAGKVDERYALSSNVSQGSEVSISRGLDIFKGSFERFKSRIRKHQRETSAWKVTRWAMHDADKFEGMLGRLKEFVDGLESLTKSLGLLQQQHERLRQEIESISDTQSLRLLRDASSRHGSSQPEVSDAASQRLITVAESSMDTQTLDFSSHLPTATDSFVTARSRPSNMPGSMKSTSKDYHQRTSNSNNRTRGASKPSASCDQCIEEHYKCILVAEGEQCPRCTQTKKDCSFVLAGIDPSSDAAVESSTIDPEPQTAPEISPVQGLPQHQRLVSDLLGKAKPRKPLSFAAGDAHYGERLAPIKKEDENYWLDHSGKIVGQAHSGSSAVKRMFFELRNIRVGKVPFVSAVPLDDSLAKVLASIEGPPETPYEGGIFFITVKLSEIDPFAPPLMRFHTKIYHPNVSPQGHICADYKEKWNAVLSAGASRLPVSDSNALWYPPKSGDTLWSMGALLTAMCGLLASPDVNDPLVPEIAQKYLEDYEGYCENARLYTKRFATGARPNDNDLDFSDGLSLNSISIESVHSKSPRPDSTTDAVSVANSSSTFFDDVMYSWPSTKYPRAGDAADVPFPILLSADDVLEVPGLHSIIDGTNLARYGAVDLADLILLARQDLPFEISRMTDLKFCHSLLEEAVAYLSGGHSRSTHEVNSQLEAVSFHEAVQRLCCNHLLRYLTNGRPVVQVQVRRHAFWTSISYQISIMPTAEGYQNWCCTRNFDEIKAFNKMLNSQIPDARLWGWETMDPRFDEPNPFLFAVVLEYSLRRAFRSHGRELLGKSESLFFLRPDSIFEASQILEPVPRSINYGTRFPDIKCFLPPSLTHGLNVSELSTEIVPCVWPIEFKLEKCANGSGNMRWVLEWDEGREFSDIKDTISVSLGNGPVSPFDAQEDSRKTLSIIHRPKGQIGSRTSLSVTFNTFEEARLVFEALQLLCRLDNIILSSQRSGETSLPLDGTRARQFADV